MLLIAIAHGSERGCDAFTCSTNILGPKVLDLFDDAKACLAYICKDKKINPKDIDCILVVDVNPDDGDPVVMHNYTDALV